MKLIFWGSKVVYYPYCTNYAIALFGLALLIAFFLDQIKGLLWPGY